MFKKANEIMYHFSTICGWGLIALFTIHSAIEIFASLFGFNLHELCNDIELLKEEMAFIKILVYGLLWLKLAEIFKK